MVTKHINNICKNSVSKLFIYKAGIRNARHRDDNRATATAAAALSLAVSSSRSKAAPTGAATPLGLAALCRAGGGGGLRFAGGRAGSSCWRLGGLGAPASAASCLVAKPFLGFVGREIGERSSNSELH
jgi:hypothetical protein